MFTKSDTNLLFNVVQYYSEEPISIALAIYIWLFSTQKIKSKKPSIKYFLVDRP